MPISGKPEIGVCSAPLRAALRPAHEEASPAGLTRGSIFFARVFFAKKMDCRVKPGNDEADIHFAIARDLLL